MLHNLFISVKWPACFRRFLRPSSGAQKCIYSIGYFVKLLLLPATVVKGSSKGLTKYPMLYMQFWAPDDGQRNCLKYVQHITEINKLHNVASCWLYRVIHKSLQDFQPLRYSSWDDHAEGEHVNRGRDTPSFCPTLQVLDTPTLGDAADVKPLIKFLPHTCNMCGRNSITGLTSAASLRVGISSTCKVGQKVGVSLPLLTCSPSVCPRLLYRKSRKSRRDLWITL